VKTPRKIKSHVTGKDTLANAKLLKLFFFYLVMEKKFNKEIRERRRNIK